MTKSNLGKTGSISSYNSQVTLYIALGTLRKELRQRPWRDVVFHTRNSTLQPQVKTSVLGITPFSAVNSQQSGNDLVTPPNTGDRVRVCLNISSPVVLPAL